MRVSLLSVCRTSPNQPFQNPQPSWCLGSWNHAGEVCACKAHPKIHPYFSVKEHSVGPVSSQGRLISNCLFLLVEGRPRLGKWGALRTFAVKSAQGQNSDISLLKFCHRDSSRTTPFNFTPVPGSHELLVPIQNEDTLNPKGSMNPYLLSIPRWQNTKPMKPSITQRGSYPYQQELETPDCLGLGQRFIKRLKSLGLAAGRDSRGIIQEESGSFT